MTTPPLIFVFPLGFLIITLLSILLKHRIDRHLGTRYGKFIHPFVALVALYYAMDAVLSRQTQFLLFWLILLVGQMILFFLKNKKG